MVSMTAKRKFAIMFAEMGWLPPSPNGIAMCQDGGKGMRTSLSEIVIDAAQVAQTARKSLETVPVWPHSALNRKCRRSRNR